MKLILFYSWQTTTDTKYNKSFIKDCINKSVNKLKNKLEFKGVEFEIQEGVTTEPGSVPVASQITDVRIPNCDIFIADLTVVNHSFPKEIPQEYHALLRSNVKPSPNPNVLIEYGVAYRELGSEKIIGVMNSHFGSPKENSDNLPFDLRHLRYPIEFLYSEDSKAEDKEKIKKEFIDNLTRAIKTTALYSIQNQKNRYNPLCVWSDWENNVHPKQRFFKNGKIEEIHELIGKSIQNPHESTRLLGLSGLGKTRILLENFRSDNVDDVSVLLSGRVLYMNCHLYPNTNINALLRSIIENGEDRIVVLDNCSLKTHRGLIELLKREDNRISLISIDSNPEEINHDKINGVNYIVIKKDDLSSVVDNILTVDFSFLSKELIEKIKEFSQGIPLMAVLIGESINKGEKFVGRLEDKDLLDKLLGPKSENEKQRKILNSCSIFNYFGIDDELSSQIEFIATNKGITSLTGDNQVIINDFHETCSHYLEREIFERKGRFIGMRPFPLSMYLAQEWLEQCSPQRLLGVITDIASLKEPDRKQLSEAFCEQMKYLGYNEKAILIIDKIIGTQSPFDNAEVLNTELGSRLFRFFVEVNPVAVSQNFVRLFSTKNTEDLLKIVEGRRNIVWVLEKLCFDKRTFAESVKVMYAFAVAENETWANNATGQFLHLFNIYLSGTEVNLNERWKIIEWGLMHPENKYQSLAMNAMKVGLAYGHFSRDGGAEKQGTRRLYDDEPNGKDILEYWSRILHKLVEITTAKNEYSDFASKTIADSIRSMYRAGFSFIILPIVKEVSDFKNNDWDEGLKGLKSARRYEKVLLSGHQLNQLNEAIDALTKKDFWTRYITIANSYHLENDEFETRDTIIEAIKKIADEFINDDLPWDENFPLFYKNHQNYSFFFGNRLYELLEGNDGSVDKFITLSVETILAIKKEERNLTLLGGFISVANEEIKGKFYAYLYGHEELNYILFYLISLDNKGEKYFTLLFDLIDQDKCNVIDFEVFSYGSVLSKLPIEALRAFSQRMFNYSDKGYSVVFDLYFSLGYNNTELRILLLPILKKCIIQLGLNNGGNDQLDNFKWGQTICLILEDENESDFAVFINDSIIKSITFENSYHLNYEAQGIYEVLMKHHFATIWPNLSEALISADEEYIKFYGLKHILGSHIGGVGRSIGILFDGDIDTIFEWCKNNKPLAPARIAELVPIFGGFNNLYSTWHPIALRLINEFGDIEDVLRYLTINMGSFSWTGSIVPLLESKKELFNTIADHKIKEVSNWARKSLTSLELDIKGEAVRDDEMHL